MNQIQPAGTITPEVYVATVKSVKEAAEIAGQHIRQWAEWAGKVVRVFTAAITQAASGLVERMLYAANDNPKWWHLYKHAKKYRTRKKYRRLLMQQLLSKLRAARAQEA